MSNKKDFFFTTLDLIPHGMKASQTALSTIANNIANESKSQKNAFEELFYKQAKKDER